MLFPCLFSHQVDRRILEYIFIHVFNQKLQLTGICNFWGGERVNKQHVSLQEPSSGATYRWWYSYSLVQSSKIAVGRHMQFLRWGERVNILHVDWWLRNGHTTPEYVNSGVVQTMVLQHYIFFRLSRCWRTWSWNANRQSLTGWYNQQQWVSSRCLKYTSSGYMYTSWWWFRLIVTIKGERNVYTKDAQQVHVIGLNHIFRCW